MAAVAAEDVAGLAAGWVDARFGPLTSLHCSRIGPPEPRWWVCTAPLARSPVGNPFSAETSAGAGTSIFRDEALTRAAGEAIERHSALNATIGGEQMTLREAELAGRIPVCGPDERCPPSCRIPPIDVPMLHVAVRTLADGAQAWLPAGFVHLNYWAESAEPLVTLPISTGLAFHRDLTTAIWGGLCEVVERDAIMSFWWLRTGAPEITVVGGEVANVPDAVLERLEMLAEAGLQARLFDITTDVEVPTVFCVVTGEKQPCLAVGASCKADPGAAVAKAIDEAIGTRVALAGWRPAPSDGNGHNEPISRLVDHAAFYADPTNRRVFDFLLESHHPRVPFDVFASRPRVAAPTDMPSLGRLAAGLAERGLTVLWADVTAPEAVSMGTVAKVVVPEMVPLSPLDAIRWLGTPRLAARSARAGTDGSPFNRFPHPFA